MSHLFIYLFIYLFTYLSLPVNLVMRFICGQSVTLLIFLEKIA